MYWKQQAAVKVRSSGETRTCLRGDATTELGPASSYDGLAEGSSLVNSDQHCWCGGSCCTKFSTPAKHWWDSSVRPLLLTYCVKESLHTLSPPTNHWACCPARDHSGNRSARKTCSYGSILAPSFSVPRPFICERHRRYVRTSSFPSSLVSTKDHKSPH